MTKEKTNFDYKKFTKNLSKNYWAIATVVLAFLLIAVLISGGITGAAVSAETAGQNVLDFAKSQGADAKLISSIDDGSLYQVILSIDGQEFPVYVTKDGNTLVPQPIPMKTTPAEQTTPAPSTPAPTEVPKSDKPIVELFVMTHCPYGTQAEKGFIPFMEAMGNLVDAKIRFVHYFMHEPEETETPRQVCIREEQSDKFILYLREFLKEGNYENAITVANIDTTKMETCISSGKWEEYYTEDATLSQEYGVQGSPTLVINGVVAQSGRDSASYLQTSCVAFNNIPTECSSLSLSSTAPSPMWGWDESGSDTVAQC